MACWCYKEFKRARILQEWRACVSVPGRVCTPERTKTCVAGYTLSFNIADHVFLDNLHHQMGQGIWQDKRRLVAVPGVRGARQALQGATIRPLPCTPHAVKSVFGETSQDHFIAGGYE